LIHNQYLFRYTSESLIGVAESENIDYMRIFVWAV